MLHWPSKSVPVYQRPDDGQIDDADNATASLYELQTDFSLTPFQLAPGIYKVLKGTVRGSMSLKVKIDPYYTLISHGLMKHRYSLVPDDSLNMAAVRPIAVYTSPGAHFKHAAIVDFTDPYDEHVPQQYIVALQRDAYARGHVVFQTCEDFAYEWIYEEFPAFSGHFQHVLWRTRLMDGHRLPAARIVPALFRNPVDNSRLWSVEFDTNRVRPLAAFLTAFTVKRLLPLPVFLPITISPPLPLENVAFNDDNRLINRSSKFFSDWEDHSDEPDVSRKTLVVQVYLSSFLETHQLPDIVLCFLQRQAQRNINALKSKYSYL